MKNISKIVKIMPDETLIQINQLMYAIAYVAVIELGLKIRRNEAIQKGKPK